MAMKSIQCQEHGGTFQVPVKRGRPPSKCTEANRCTMARAAKGPRSAEAVAKRTAETLKGRMPAKSTGERRAAKVAQANASRQTKRRPAQYDPAQKATRTRPTASDVTVRHNPSVVMGKKAKDVLEPQGWTVNGRAWIDEDEIAWAEVTGTRGEETIAVRWANGKFVSQDYSLWDADKTPGQQGMPKTNLPFDPYEMSDEELAKELAGRKVTWWNRIASATETAIVGDKFQIQHNYTGGNETSRQVLFVDQTPMHNKFRAFNIDALMRVK
jgi:hypothetical protein